MSSLVKRLLDGTPEITLVVDGVQYDYYKLLRMEQDYPQDENDGYLITSGAVAPAGLNTVYNDTLNIKDGTVIYYSLFVRSIANGLYELQDQGWVLGLVPNFDEIAIGFFPEVLRPQNDVDNTGNPNFFREGIVEPVFGEVEALIRVMGKQRDLWQADPIVLSNLARIYNWYPIPQTTLAEFRDQVDSLLDFYRDGKGQYEAEIEMLADISQLPVLIQDWHKNICSADLLNNQHVFEFTPIGVGDGATVNFGYTAAWTVIPFTVRITFDGFTYTDDPVSLLAGNVINSAGVSVGTIDYSTGVFTLGFDETPLLGSTVWIFYEFEMQGLDLTDAETQTRYDYWGDRIAYAPSQSKDSDKTGVGISVYFYLHNEIGEEGVFTFAGPYEKIYVDDILRKMRIVYPLFGDTDCTFVDRFAVTFDELEYLANLPVEQEAGVLEQEEPGCPE